MGSNQSNTTDVTQTVMTNVFEETATSCNATCTEVQSGNVVIIENDTIGGSAGFAESCQVSASCMMNNTLDTQVTDILSSITSQSNSAVTDILSSLSFNNETNSANITQNTTQNITQIIDSTCNATLAFTQTDNLFYASDSGISGFAGFQIGQDVPSSANASCSMSNMSKAVVYNSVQAQTTQSNSTMGAFALIAAAIVACLIIGGILIVAMGGMKSFNKSGTPAASKEGGSSQNTDYTELAKIASDNPELSKAALSAI